MAQKIHPINYRSAHNFENLSCLQQAYGNKYKPYVLREHTMITNYVKGFFKNFDLGLHSFKYTKTIQGVAHLTIKYVPISSRPEKASVILKPFQFSTVEKAFLYGLSEILPKHSLRVSFSNLLKGKVKKDKNYSSNLNSYFFSSLEISTYLKALLSIKGGAFFLANILSMKLNKMRSRADRKSQNKFLLFTKLLLSHILKHNIVGIKGLRVSIKGRINGAPRSKPWIASEGKMSLQGMDAKIDYFYLPSQTVYGTFGVKVWINYG